MTGWSVLWLFVVPVSVALAMACSEELWQAVVWLRALRVRRVTEEYMPVYLGLTFPSGRVVRLMPLPTARNDEE